MKTQTDRREWNEINVLRGIAGVYMVVHHVWAAFQPPLNAIGQACVFVGSFAPVVFFFVTGIGYGVQGARRGRLTGASIKKVVILLVADQMLAWQGHHLLGLDFLGFIGLSTLMLEGVARAKRPVRLAAALALAIVFLRYGVGSNAALARLGAADAGWLRIAVGASVPLGLSYPLCPWLTFPLLGFVAGRAVRDRRTPDGRLSGPVGWVVAGPGVFAGAAAAVLSWRGAVFFRWGAVSLAFFVTSFAVISATVLTTFLIVRSPRLGESVSLRGLSSLAVVPLHYLFIAIAQSVGVWPHGEGSLALVILAVAVAAFSSAKGVARSADRLSGNRYDKRPIWLALAATVPISAAILLGSDPRTRPLLTAGFLAGGQLALTALLAVRWEGARLPAPVGGRLARAPSPPRS